MTHVSHTTDEPSAQSRLSSWILRETLGADAATQAKAVDLMQLACVFLDPDAQRREHMLQTWPGPLDESALPLLGQMAQHCPEAVAALPFPWLEPWQPKLSSIPAAHQRLDENNRVMRAANFWLSPWSPVVLMLGSPRYWKCWVDDHVAPHPGIVRLRSSAPLMTDTVIARMTQCVQDVRLRVLEALQQRGALGPTSDVACPTLDTQDPVPLGLALVAMGTPLPEGWKFPDALAGAWWQAVVSGMDERPDRVESWLPQVRRLTRTRRLTLTAQEREQFDQPLPHSPWPWPLGVLVGRVLVEALQHNLRNGWLETATDAMVSGLAALPRERRGELMTLIMEDTWTRGDTLQSQRQRMLTNLTKHILSNWNVDLPDRMTVAQDFMRAAAHVSVAVGGLTGVPQALFGLSLVDNTTSADNVTPSPWRGALTHEDLETIVPLLWTKHPGTQSKGVRVPSNNNSHVWPSGPLLFKVARAGPVEYYEALLALAQEWAQPQTTVPEETRRLEFLGRYTQLLARRAQPEAPAARQRM